MTLLRSILHCILLAVAIVAIASFAWEWTLTNRAARASLSPLVSLGAQANSTLGAINAPCTGNHGSYSCGALAQLAQTEKNIGIVAGQSALQVKQSGKLIDSAAESIQSVAAHVNTLADAGTRATSSATLTIQEAQATIRAAQPLLASLNQSAQASTVLLNSANARLRDPQIDALLAHIEGMSDSGDKMLADARWKEHEILHPTPAKGFKAVVGGAILWLHKLEPPIF